MNLSVQMMRKLLQVAAVVCFCSADVQLQTENKSNSSTIRGTAVYSDTGRPLRHARVTLLNPENRGQADTVTDLSGHFVFSEVPAGKYLLTLEAPGLLQPYSNLPRVETIVMESRWPDKTDLVTEVSVNGTDSIDLKVQAVRGGVITGRVVTEDDQPLVNANVKLLRRENGKWVPVWTTWANNAEMAERKTDASGVYRIAALPSGDYIVRVSEPWIQADSVPGDEDAYGNGSFMVAYYPVATRLKDAEVVSVVAGTESTDVDIRLKERPTYTLSGTVKFAGLQQPGGSVDITIERSDEAGFTTTLREVTVRADWEGKWRVPGLPAGEYVVTIGGRRETMDTDGGFPFLEALSKRTTVRIGNEKETVLNTTLTLGAQVKGKVTGVEGKSPHTEWFMSPGVKPADDANDGADRETNGPQFHSALVGKDERFTITALKPGTYWFTMQLLGKHKAYVKSVTRKGVNLMQTPFKLAEDEVFDEVVVTLATDLARVEGHVILPEGMANQPLTVIVAPATKATRRFTSGSQNVDVDPKGRIVFRSAPGEYFIAALPTAEYEKLKSQLDYEYFDKHADKFVRLKLSAGAKVKALPVPMMKK